MNFYNKRTAIGFVVVSSFITMTAFQNCSGSKLAISDNASLDAQQIANSTDTSSDPSQDAPGDLGVCNGVSCELTPLTTKPAVTTILLALGDQANSQLVIKGGSSQLIAETVVRYSTPVENPKILLIKDINSNTESVEDPGYVKNTLLARYAVTEVNEPSTGFTVNDFDGYDLVWFNNPGHSMGLEVTKNALIAFKGGVILQGDDLSQGKGFSPSDLTGLSYVDNGTSIKCNGKTYNTDNNTGAQFTVQLDASKFTGSASDELSFNYGNDIDKTTILRSDIEVLATAKGSPSDCTESRPTIVRYFK